MTHVATLVCNPTFPSLTERLLQLAIDALPKPGPSQWLDKGVAADIPFAPDEPVDARAIADAVRAVIGAAEIDVIVQPAQGRRKKLFLADMDSTMIGQECIDELAAQTGKKQFVVEITQRAMRGEIEFEPALRERVALLKGLHPDTILRVIAKKITLTPGGRTLVQTMRRDGAYTALISGGFTNFTSVIAEKIGFHENQANALLLGEDGRLLGLVAEPILGKEGKRAALLRLREDHGLPAEATLAVGDGANDLAMLEAAGLGVAYRAQPMVAAAAHARIVHADLTALLYAQGYKREEFFAEPRPQLDPADWKRKYGAMEKAHERTRL
ncbi:phosphoserine phosphatase SerB [Methylocapsa aurea]|uniref:phosphoserine phosphatase SerB n=1 Tax=Methylocapsa aurea TaxID=663610 RepID=UPI00055FDD34|nr:phosphoserine phosphatase SerB [Methylocapsa aurea]